MNAPIKSPDKFAEAKRFLLALSPNGPWALTAIRPFSAFGGRRTETLFCTTIEQAESFIAEHNGKLNLHFTANQVHHVTDKPRERNIVWLIFVQVDVDKDAYGRRLTAETKQHLVELLQDPMFLKNAGLPGPPTFIIDSGNGIQALWRLSPPLSPTSENLHHVKQMNAFAIEATNGDKGTHNPVHLARLPGTTNIPSASKLKDGLVECQSKLLVSTGLSYAPSAFQQKEVLHLVAEGTSPIGAGDPIESLDALLQWNVWEAPKRQIDEGRGPAGTIKDDTDSGWQHKTTIELIMCKVPDTVIKGILTDPKWGISRSILKEGRSREVDEYVDRQIHRAHRAYEAWLRKSDFPDDGVELLYQDMFDDEQVSEQAGGQEAEAKPRRREYSLQEAREWRDPKFIIDGLIPYDGTVVIYGPPKSFKTYAASSIAMHAAMGKDFYGQECTKRVVVTYVAAEGGRVNFRDRCLAWCKEHNVDYNDTTGWFWMVTEPVNLTDEKDLRRFVELRDNQRRGIIFFDTLAKNSGSADEDTAGMKDACEGANWVRLQTGATVVLIHHEGKDPSRGVRGSTVLLGDVDIAIRIVKDVKNKLKPKCLMRIEAARAIRDGKTWMFEPTNHVIDDSLSEEMALHFLNSWGPDENRPTEKSEAGDTALPHQAEPKFVDDFVILKLYELQEGRTRTQLMADGGWKKTALYNAVAELAEHKLVAIDKKSGIVTMTQGGRDAALLFGAERRGEDAEMDTDYGLD